MLQPRIDRIALQRQHTEHGFVDLGQRLAGDEASQRLLAKQEFADGERALLAKAA